MGPRHAVVWRLPPALVSQGKPRQAPEPPLRHYRIPRTSLLATTNLPTPSMFWFPCGMLPPQTPSSDAPLHPLPAIPRPTLSGLLQSGLVAWLIGVHLLAMPGSAGQGTRAHRGAGIVPGRGFGGAPFCCHFANRMNAIGPAAGPIFTPPWPRPHDPPDAVRCGAARCAPSPIR